MKKTIAEHMADILREENMRAVWFGDIVQIHECAVRAGIYERVRGQHGDRPLRVIQKVLNALERSDLFEKGYIRFDGNKAPCRSFKLRVSV